MPPHKPARMAGNSSFLNTTVYQFRREFIGTGNSSWMCIGCSICEASFR